MEAKVSTTKQSVTTAQRLKFLKKQWYKNKYVYIMLLPVLTYFIIFNYVPMYGAIIAFKNFSPAKGILGSPWAGFSHFNAFFHSYYFWRLLRNTILLNVYDIIFGFPAPIILALLLNEVKNQIYKRTVQTISYLPHFISIVVIAGIILEFTSRDGLINDILAMLGLQRIPFMTMPQWFRTIYVGSGIWQGVGWGSIIYLAALSNIDPQLYEAAKIDGAGRWKQMIHVTLPGILPTIVIMLILRFGAIMSADFQKIILIYNPTIYDTADVISTFVYRQGILMMDYSYSTAVGLFNSVISFILVIVVNKISRMLTENSLW
ncbi:ABC transporter permease [Caldanaerobius polysaccharolyticus]|uniref:ABC transporter permease n=1 Tax=Caldanaerobius polysaccharolyticus TaxID=44256 RepID=UPI00068BE939|nr:ABC transporter permease subunit [Caldanaerobius polysaccharolyticus]